MGLEIERKFLLPGYPADLEASGQLTIVSKQKIEQTYLALADKEELRVRRLCDESTGEVSFTHTYKSGEGLVREEIEYPIGEELYDKLIAQLGLKPLVKTRCTALYEGIELEIDDYSTPAFTVVEVEFPSEELALAFNPPSWFGQDISTDRRYSNKTVWRDLQQQGG